MMHFPPVSDSPYFSDSRKFSKFYLFLKNFLILIRQNFWWPFFSHRPPIYNFPPIFPVLVHFPPFSRRFVFPPVFTNSPWFRKIHLFLHTLRVFRFHLLLPWCIYASPNARTGRPCLKYSEKIVEIWSAPALQNLRLHHWQPHEKVYYLHIGLCPISRDMSLILSCQMRFFWVFRVQAWASIVGWTEGQIPPTFGTGWTEYALSPLLFEAHLCLFLCILQFFIIVTWQKL